MELWLHQPQTWRRRSCGGARNLLRSSSWNCGAWDQEPWKLGPGFQSPAMIVHAFPIKAGKRFLSLGRCVDRGSDCLLSPSPGLMSCHWDQIRDHDIGNVSKDVGHQDRDRQPPSVSSHRPLRLLSGETQEPGHLLLPRRHQEQQRPRAAESHEGRDRVLLAVDGGTRRRRLSAPGVSPVTSS